MDRSWRESKKRGPGDAPALFGLGHCPMEARQQTYRRRSGDNLGVPSI